MRNAIPYDGWDIGGKDSSCHRLKSKGADSSLRGREVVGKSWEEEGEAVVKGNP